MRIYTPTNVTVFFQKWPAYYDAGTGPAQNAGGWGGVVGTDKIVLRSGDKVILRNGSYVTERLI